MNFSVSERWPTRWRSFICSPPAIRNLRRCESRPCIRLLLTKACVARRWWQETEHIFDCQLPIADLASVAIFGLGIRFRRLGNDCVRRVHGKVAVSLSSQSANGNRQTEMIHGLE